MNRWPLKWLVVLVSMWLVACPDDEKEATPEPQPGKAAVEPAGAHDQAAHAEHEHTEHGAQNDPHAGHAHMKMPSGDPLTGESIYQLQSQWTDQHGKKKTLEAFRAKIVVLAMVYTHCEFACPRIIADMRRIRDAMDDDRVEQVQFVLVSIDPKRDTVQRLQSFGEETGLTDQGWTLLRGEPDDIRELAAVFGVQYRKTTETDFAHSNIISVLDRQGEIVHQQEGLGVDPDDTVAAIEKRLADDAEK